MRIWHEQLIPKLCQKHLCACWREALGAYKIITEGKKGYSNHPATKEFADAPLALFIRLQLIRTEMLSRGYHPKPMPRVPDCVFWKYEDIVHEWQSLNEQVEILKAKNCKCNI